MNERPIIFSAEMVRAILEGRKTVTRRIVNPQPPASHQWQGWIIESSRRKDEGKACWAVMDGAHARDAHRVRCPYGQPGDRLWVRETWAETDREDGTPVIAYRAGGNIAIGRDHPKGNDYLIDTIAWDDMPHVETWRPSIHMPRWASRITLEIGGVRVERLQDISEDDAYAEGVTHAEWGGMNAREGFRRLWKSLNGPGSWEANPWVWVIEFKRAENKA